MRRYKNWFQPLLFKRIYIEVKQRRNYSGAGKVLRAEDPKQFKGLHKGVLARWFQLGSYDKLEPEYVEAVRYGRCAMKRPYSGAPVNQSPYTKGC